MKFVASTYRITPPAPWRRRRGVGRAPCRSHPHGCHTLRTSGRLSLCRHRRVPRWRTHTQRHTRRCVRGATATRPIHETSKGAPCPYSLRAAHEAAHRSTHRRPVAPATPQPPRSCGRESPGRLRHPAPPRPARRGVLQMPLQESWHHCLSDCVFSHEKSHRRSAAPSASGRSSVPLGRGDGGAVHSFVDGKAQLPVVPTFAATVKRPHLPAHAHACAEHQIRKVVFQPIQPRRIQHRRVTLCLQHVIGGEDGFNRYAALGYPHCV